MRGEKNDPIVATPLRTIVSAIFAFAITTAIGVRLRRVQMPSFMADPRSPHHSFEIPIVATIVIALVAALLVVIHLRGEEARLTRQLRTARTGTARMRKLALEKRRRFTTGLGAAAISLADGDRSGALDALAASSAWLAYGRVSKLRAIVLADAARANESETEIANAVATLRTLDPMNHVEADRYRVHVLVKSILEGGDLMAARDVVHDLADAKDEDVRVYVAWLRAWFAFDHVPAPSEVERRLAILLAKNHGATELVEKLEAPAIESAANAPVA